jgi:DNA-binding CsgD family transcriptional regulator
MASVLERERELAALEATVEAIAGGSGPTLVLEGHPGLGKSTLLAGLAAGAAGVRVLRFRCGELERQLAWAGVVGLLGPALDALPTARRTRLLQGPAAAAGALFGSEPLPATPAAAELDRFAVFAALQRLVAELGAGAPLLLVLDDAHWCDRPTLGFLGYLQRRLAELPAGLVLATRPPAMVDQTQRVVLEQIMSAPDAQVLTLRPLGRDSVAELVRAQLPAAGLRFCDTCWEVTAGNPFFLHELLLELAGHDDVADRLDAEALSQITPPAVLRSLLVRLDRLPIPGAAALAEAAAVLGEGATLEQAAAVAEIDAAAAVDALDALTSAELLAPGEPLRFVHPLVRAAIYAEIPAARRAQWHGRAGALLAAAHASPEVVALQLLHAPRRADPATVSGLRAGAERARAQGAPRAAARYLRRALEEPPDPERRIDVLTELARAEIAFGDRSGIDHLQAALELTDDPRRRAALLVELGWAEHDAGRFPAAAVAFEQGLQTLEAAAPVEGTEDRESDAELADRLETGYLVAATLDSDRVADANERIRAIEASPMEIQTPGRRMLLSQVLFLRTMSGTPHVEIVDLALRLWADGRMLREDGVGANPALWHVIGALSWADAYGPALRAIELTLAAAEERGLALAQAQARYARAWPRFWTGDLLGAQDDARRAIEIWDGGLETYLPAAVYWFGLASLELGEPARAEAALVRTAPLARWEGTGMAGFIHALEGHIHLHHGRVEEAVASQRACGEVMTSLMIANPSPMPWRSELARALRLLGEAGEAEGRAVAAAELEAALRSGAPRSIGVARASLGLCTPGEAGIAELTRGVAELAACGARLPQTRALVDLGARVRRAGRPREARTPLREGLELAQAMGAVVLARRAEIELRAAGARGRRPTEGGAHTLTASELRVAELAAAGHTNRAIAGMLEISVKAVEWHLHQSYRKLDVRGRAELSGALAG